MGVTEKERELLKDFEGVTNKESELLKDFKGVTNKERGRAERCSDESVLKKECND